MRGIDMKLKDARNLKAYVYFHYDLPNGDHMSEKAVVNSPVIALQSHPLCCTELSFTGPLESWVDQNRKQEISLMSWIDRNRMPEAAHEPGLIIFNEVKTKLIERIVKRVIFNDPVTVVIWTDGSKTIVRCQDGEPYDPEKGLAMCMAKKMLGNNGNYYDIFHKYLDEYKEDEAMKKKLAKAVKKKAKKGKKK